MTMEQMVRAEAVRMLSEAHGETRAQELVAGAEVRALPAAWVDQYESRILIELKESENAPLSWVVMLSEEQDRALCR